MFGLTALEHALQPQTTLEKMIFLVENVFEHFHRTTTFVSFGALLVLVFLRTAKAFFKKWWWIYRLPEVLVVVVVSTSSYSKTGKVRVCLADLHFLPTVLCDLLRWDEDGVSILGSVPIHAGTFIAFPLRHRNLAYVRKTTSTAV
jgi:hypothetical protein